MKSRVTYSMTFPMIFWLAVACDSSDTDAEPDASDVGEEVDTSEEMDSGEDSDSDTGPAPDTATGEVEEILEVDTSNQNSWVLEMESQECADGTEDDFAHRTNCIDSECKGNDCCEGTVCGNAVLGDSAEYRTHYCFPEAAREDLDAGVDGGARCACGEVVMELALDDALSTSSTVCFPDAKSASTRTMKFNVFSKEYFDSRPDGQLAMEDIEQFPTNFVETKIPHLRSGDQPVFTLGYGLESTTDSDEDGVVDGRGVVLVFQGIKGMNTVWMLQLYVPSSQFEAPSVLETSLTRGQTNQFYATLIKGKLSGSNFEVLWMEALAWDGILTLKNAPRYCETGGGAGCEPLEYEFDIRLAGARAELVVD